MSNQQLTRSIENAELAIEYAGKYMVVLPPAALLTVATAGKQSKLGTLIKI